FHGVPVLVFDKHLRNHVGPFMLLVPLFGILLICEALAGGNPLRQLRLYLWLLVWFLLMNLYRAHSSRRSEYLKAPRCPVRQEAGSSPLPPLASRPEVNPVAQGVQQGTEARPIPLKKVLFWQLVILLCLIVSLAVGISVAIGGRLPMGLLGLGFLLAG